MATVAGLYGLGEESRKYRIKQAALDREKHEQHKQTEKTPDALSEP